MLTVFPGTAGFGYLYEDRCSEFVPNQALRRPGQVFGSLAVSSPAAGNASGTWTCCAAAQGSLVRFPRTQRCPDSWRSADQPEAFDHVFITLMRRMRSRIWAFAWKRNPAVLATRLEPLLIDIDTTLVTAHSTGMNTPSGPTTVGMGSRR